MRHVLLCQTLVQHCPGPPRDQAEDQKRRQGPYYHEDQFDQLCHLVVQTAFLGRYRFPRHSTNVHIPQSPRSDCQSCDSEIHPTDGAPTEHKVQQRERNHRRETHEDDQGYGVLSNCGVDRSHSGPPSPQFLQPRPAGVPPQQKQNLCCDPGGDEHGRKGNEHASCESKHMGKESCSGHCEESPRNENNACDDVDCHEDDDSMCPMLSRLFDKGLG
mmetsp:Transcript_32824/g.65026  ORF Transcript_32824/g.65026 Transcript_32824/m.65026 type:complete len:216 (+) Transcript_32824:272-919(+)